MLFERECECAVGNIYTLFTLLLEYVTELRHGCYFYQLNQMLIFFNAGLAQSLLNSGW
jgi:hypothetical protein